MQYNRTILQHCCHRPFRCVRTSVMKQRLPVTTLSCFFSHITSQSQLCRFSDFKLISLYPLASQSVLQLRSFTLSRHVWGLFHVNDMRRKASQIERLYITFQGFSKTSILQTLCSKFCLHSDANLTNIQLVIVCLKWTASQRSFLQTRPQFLPSFSFFVRFSLQPEAISNRVLYEMSHVQFYLSSFSSRLFWSFRSLFVCQPLF